MKKITLFGLMFYVCSVFAQGPYIPPYSTDFNTEGEITADWTLENPAGKGIWIYSPDYFGIDETGSLVFLPSGTVQSDNWAFTPSLALTAGVNYALDFKYMNLFPGFQAHLKVSIGTQAASASMNTDIVNIGAYDLNEPNWNACATSHTVFTVPTTGNYYIGLNDAGSVAPNMDGGQFIEDLSVIQSSGSGVQTVNSNTISIYPNPATDFICFNSSDQKINKVQVYDVTGMLVKEVMGSSAVDIRDLSNGVYVIKAFVDNNVFVGKINKQ